jgi:hypothetical protein
MDRAGSDSGSNLARAASGWARTHGVAGVGGQPLVQRWAHGTGHRVGCDGADVRDPERPTGRVVHGVLGDHGAAVVRRAGRRSVHPRVGDERRRGQLLGPPRSRSHRSSPIIIAGEPGQRRPSAPPIGLGAAVVDLHHQFGKGWGVIIASRTCADAARGPSVTADSQAVVRDLARTGTIAGQS